MYHVTYWETSKIYKSFEKLAIAKKYARGLGHTGEDIPNFKNYPPVAYVANDNDEVVYNPRFSKKISSSVSSIVNTFDSNLH